MLQKFKQIFVIHFYKYNLRENCEKLVDCKYIISNRINHFYPIYYSPIQYQTKNNDLLSIPYFFFLFIKFPRNLNL